MMLRKRTATQQYQALITSLLTNQHNTRYPANLARHLLDSTYNRYIAERRLALQTRQPLALLEDIQQLRKDLTVASALNTTKIAELHATEMSLHPSFAAVVILDRGFYAAKAITIAKQQGYRTILISESKDTTTQAAQIADHILLVKDIGNVKQCIRALNKFRNAIAIDDYHFAIDPGFGKLSESPELAKACIENQYIFVGPHEQPMRTMGNKKSAKHLATLCGVPVIPGYYGKDQETQTLLREASRIGYPLMVKKGISGGGYGNELVTNEEKLSSAISNFHGAHATEPVFLEKFLVNPSHIEVQVAFTQNEFVILGTRDCSLQRNFQKYIECAPAKDHLTQKVLPYAKQIAKGMMREGYTHVATIEFLVTPDGEAYFLEVNPRIQVEHSITEAIHSDISLIALKYWIASGQSLAAFFRNALQERKITNHGYTLEQMVAALNRHSPSEYVVQARIDAGEFLRMPDGSIAKAPVKGTITDLQFSNVEMISGVRVGTEVDTMTTNPLLAIVIARGNTPIEAVTKLNQSLHQIQITGIPTNLARLKFASQYLIDHPNEAIHTGTTAKLDELYPQTTEMKAPVNPLPIHHLFYLRDITKSDQSRIPHIAYSVPTNRGGSWD